MYTQKHFAETFCVRFLNAVFVKRDSPFLRHSSTLSRTSAIALCSMSPGMSWISSPIRCFSGGCNSTFKINPQKEVTCTNIWGFCCPWNVNITANDAARKHLVQDVHRCSGCIVAPSCCHHGSPQLRPRQLIWRTMKDWHENLAC
jgi:hypothetical protein